MLTSRDIRAICPDLPLFEQEPMRLHTSFRIGGPADLLAKPRSEAELQALLSCASAHETPVLLMGNGTNLLVSDAGVRGLVVKTHDGLSQVQRVGETRVAAGSGVLLSRLATAALSWGLAGLAFAHGIPGTVGGAVAMNAGAYGGEMKDTVWETAYHDGQGGEKTLSKDDHVFSYRRSFFADHPHCVAVRTIFQLCPADRDVVKRDMDQYAQRRKASQPLEMPSAGSVFKRPPGRFAGTMIEACGLKGFACGGAQVSEKHAGFIVNRGGATCDDVLRLIVHIQETVLRQEGVRLEPEIKLVGQ